jgi:hypothetical protein
VAKNDYSLSEKFFVGETPSKLYHSILLPHYINSENNT